MKVKVDTFELNNLIRRYQVVSSKIVDIFNDFMCKQKEPDVLELSKLLFSYNIMTDFIQSIESGYLESQGLAIDVMDDVDYAVIALESYLEGIR